jgi:hypothetical protein
VGLTGLLAVPVSFLLIRRAELASTVARAQVREVATAAAIESSLQESACALQISAHASAGPELI